MAYAGISADSVARESVGSLTLLVATFSGVTSHLWINGVPNAISYWAAGESTSVSVSTAMASDSATGSSSGVYFYMQSNEAGSAQQARLFILSKI